MDKLTKLREWILEEYAFEPIPYLSIMGKIDKLNFEQEEEQKSPTAEWFYKWEYTKMEEPKGDYRICSKCWALKKDKWFGWVLFPYQVCEQCDKEPSEEIVEVPDFEYLIENIYWYTTWTREGEARQMFDVIGKQVEILTKWFQQLQRQMALLLKK